MKPILVIGGINMDILGAPHSALILRDSAPGKVSLRPGGVGRNIAMQLARMGQPVELMAPFGDDLLADKLLESCEKDRIGTRYAPRLKGSSCTYMAIHDLEGDMLAAINSMALMKALHAESIKQSLPQDGFSACVLDANLITEALIAAADHVKAPLIADPVSTMKADRLLPILPRLRAIKPNLIEARYLSGCDQPEDAAACLLAKGVREVYISLGPEGIYFASGADKGHIKPAELIHAPATGAGDAMVAGIAAAISQGLRPREAALMGMKQAEAQLQQNLALEAQEGSFQ